MANHHDVVELMREADSYHKFWIEERAARIKADTRAVVLGNQIAELVAALEVAREFLDPESPPPRMGNTSALELINAALAKVTS